MTIHISRLRNEKADEKLRRTLWEGHLVIGRREISSLHLQKFLCSLFTLNLERETFKVGIQSQTSPCNVVLDTRLLLKRRETSPSSPIMN